MPEARLYHVWFATKRRRWLLQGDVAEKVKRTLREVAHDKGILLLECETAIDHVHMLLRLADGQELPKALNLLKGISARRLNQAFPELKLDAHLNHFWQRGCGFAVVEPPSLGARLQYVRTQMERLDKFDRPEGRRQAAAFRPR